MFMYSNAASEWLGKRPSSIHWAPCSPHTVVGIADTGRLTSEPMVNRPSLCRMLTDNLSVRLEGLPGPHDLARIEQELAYWVRPNNGLRHIVGGRYLASPGRARLASVLKRSHSALAGSLSKLPLRVIRP